MLLADRYQTTDVFGVGGAASVYRAVDRNLGRDVAIKVSNPTTSDDDNYRRQHTETVTRPSCRTLYFVRSQSTNRSGCSSPEDQKTPPDDAADLLVETASASSCGMDTEGVARSVSGS